MNEGNIGKSELEKKSSVFIEHGLAMEGDQNVLELTNNAVEEAHSKCVDFYGYAAKESLEIFVTDRAGLNKVSKDETPNWVVGINHSKGISLIDPRLYDSQTNRPFSEENYRKLITHETGHRYFREFIGIGFEESKFMTWFNEGIQLYLAGQKENTSSEPFESKDLFNPDDPNIYEASVRVIRAIEKKHGENVLKSGVRQILQDLKEVKEAVSVESGDRGNVLEETFNNSFEKVFGVRVDSEELEKLVNN